MVLRKEEAQLLACRFDLAEQCPIVQQGPFLVFVKVSRAVDFGVDVVVPTILEDGRFGDQIFEHAIAHELKLVRSAGMVLFLATIPVLGLQSVAMKEGKNSAGPTLWKSNIDDRFREAEFVRGHVQHFYR